MLNKHNVKLSLHNVPIVVRRFTEKEFAIGLDDIKLTTALLASGWNLDYHTAQLPYLFISIKEEDNPQIRVHVNNHMELLSYDQINVLDSCVILDADVVLRPVCSGRSFNAQLLELDILVESTHFEKAALSFIIQQMKTLFDLNTERGDPNDYRTMEASKKSDRSTV